MNQVLVVILFTAMQFCAGFGLLNLFRVALKPVQTLAVSVLIGVAVFSVIPFLLQLFFLPINAPAVFSALTVACLATSFGSLKNYSPFLHKLKKVRFDLKLAELPFLFIAALLLFLSIWRCFYYPPTPRDLTSGPEVIAEYAVKENTMVNSVFSVSLESTNNPFKPPYLTALQIVYKLAGFPFGQVWLSTVVLTFVIFLYMVLRRHLHPLFAGMLLVFFLVIPEMYAYTIMALFDYSNAVFFTLAVYFFVAFLKKRESRYLHFSSLLMGIATYIRSETLLLAGITAFAALLSMQGKKEPWCNAPLGALLYLLPSLAVYLITITLYIRAYLPVQYPVENLLNEHLLNPAAFFNRFQEVTSTLLLGSEAVAFFGYFIYLFFTVALLDAFVYRKWPPTGKYFLIAVMTVYAGIVLIGHLFPLMDIENSSKRAMFKLFPLMLLYMAHSPLLVSLSGKVAAWENAKQPLVMEPEGK